METAGYTTALSGKWHLGEAKETWPQRRGFSNFYGLPQGGGTYFYPFLINREVWLNDEKIIPKPGFYSTDAFNQYAAEFIDNQKNSSKPFFLYLAHVAPHFPLQAKPEVIAKYRGKYKSGFEAIRNKWFAKQKNLVLVDKNLKLSPIDESSLEWNRLSEAERDNLDLKMAIYAAQLSCMDIGIGNIIKKLKTTGQLDNTGIFFSLIMKERLLWSIMFGGLTAL